MFAYISDESRGQADSGWEVAANSGVTLRNGSGPRYSLKAPLIAGFSHEESALVNQEVVAERRSTQDHSPLAGTAARRSPNGSVSAPVYRTTPALKRSPSLSRR